MIIYLSKKENYNCVIIAEGTEYIVKRKDRKHLLIGSCVFASIV